MKYRKPELKQFDEANNAAGFCMTGTGASTAGAIQYCVVGGSAGMIACMGGNGDDASGECNAGAAFVLPPSCAAGNSPL